MTFLDGKVASKNRSHEVAAKFVEDKSCYSSPRWRDAIATASPARRALRIDTHFKKEK